MARFQNIVITACVIAIITILFYLSTGDLTIRETGLLSTLLTVLSIIATLIVAHIYSQSTYRKALEEVKDTYQSNIKTYALNAAEKVNNLSNQLSSLSAYLQEDLDQTEFESVNETLRSREERIESSIQIINMLRSVNDTTLSDWKGVIGDELEEQREEREEREEEIRELIDRIASLEDRWYSDTETRVLRHEASQIMLPEIDNLRKKVRRLVSGVTGTPVRFKKPRKRIRREIEIECPSCKEKICYKQKEIPNSIKAIECSNCSEKFVSRYNPDDNTFSLDLQLPETIQFECPACKSPCSVTIDLFPGAVGISKCESCDSEIRVSRGTTKMRFTLISLPQKVTDEIIDKVRANLPEQPWPKYIHKKVGANLNLSNAVVSKAINELIERGFFKTQKGGKVYDLVEVTTIKENDK